MWPDLVLAGSISYQLWRFFQFPVRRGGAGSSLVLSNLEYVRMYIDIKMMWSILSKPWKMYPSSIVHGMLYLNCSSEARRGIKGKDKKDVILHTFSFYEV